MIVKKEIIINAPQKKVWQIFSDIEKWPKLSSFILKAYWNSQEKWALNSTFTQILKGILPSIKLSSTPKIIKIDSGENVTWTGSRIVIRGIHTFKFEKIKNKTKVINIEYFKGPLAPIIFPFVKYNIESYFEQFLNGLKRESEK